MRIITKISFYITYSLFWGLVAASASAQDTPAKSAASGKMDDAVKKPNESKSGSMAMEDSVKQSDESTTVISAPMDDSVGGVSSLSSDAQNKGSPESELIYRTNLGSAADVALLLKQGLSPNTRNGSNVPILSLAAARKDKEGTEIVQRLVQKGADVNARDSEGQTPLFYAAKYGNKRTTQYLLEHKADYYLTDNKGDIPRIIAHREGHPELVTLMDDFVRKQSEEVNKQYKRLNKTIEERYKLMEKQVESPPAASAPSSKTPVPLPAAVDTAVSIPPPSPPSPPALDTQKLQQLVYEISFNSCAFQYWSYCSMTNSRTELTPDALATAIDDSRQKVIDINKEIIADFKVKQSYVDRITGPSKSSVFEQLEAMPSKTYRREHGVGMVKDMQKRCDWIAKNWQVTADGTNDMNEGNTRPNTTKNTAPGSLAPSMPQQDNNMIRKMDSGPGVASGGIGGVSGGGAGNSDSMSGSLVKPYGAMEVPNYGKAPATSTQRPQSFGTQ